MKIIDKVKESFKKFWSALGEDIPNCEVEFAPNTKECEIWEETSNIIKNLEEGMNNGKNSKESFVRKVENDKKETRASGKSNEDKIILETSINKDERDR